MTYPRIVFLLQQLKAHGAFLILLACAAALFLSDIWRYKEFIRAESYFAVGARLMVEQDEWLAPHAPDEVQLNKPPLTYWLIGISYKLFGISYGTARLSSVLSALLILIIIYVLGLRLDGKRTGFTSAALLASSYIFLSFARMAMSDMLLTLCVMGALACFIISLTDEARRSQKLALVGYVSLAFGILTKGPVAVALVTAPLIFELAVSRRRADLKRLRLLIGPLLTLFIVAPYFLVIYARIGIEPLRFFFIGENFQRFTGVIYGSKVQPFWYEIVAFFGDFAPWSLLVLLAIWLDWRKRERDEGRRRSSRILYLWLGCTILLFSLSSFKLDYYLLPAMPAAALIIGRAIANAGEVPLWARRVVQGFLLFFSVVLVIAGILSVRVADVIFYETPLSFLPVATAIAGAVMIVAFAVRRQVWHAAMMLTAAIWAMMLIMQLTFQPFLARYLPIARLAASVPREVVYTSRAASDWSNDLIFNLAPTHRVERLMEDVNNAKLQGVLQNDSHACALVREGEYSMLRERGLPLKILAQGETLGHGGLNWNKLRHPKPQQLLLIVKDESP